MKYLSMVCVLSLALLSGCAQAPQAANSSEAITQSKTIESVEAQVKYLVKEANTFINNEKFDEAIQTAKYILNELDKESVEAKALLERAQAELKKMAEQKAEELKGKMKEKLNLGQ